MGSSVYLQINGFNLLYTDIFSSHICLNLADDKVFKAIRDKDPALFEALFQVMKDSGKIEEASIASAYFETWLLNCCDDPWEGCVSLLNNPYTTEDTKRKASNYLNGITTKEPEKPKSKKDKSGYIYLILAETGQYKIGYSKRLFDRVKTFQVKLPFEIELIHQFPADDMYQAERELHSYFAAHRVNGEWFSLSPEQVEEIKAITKYESGDFVT